MFLSVVIPTARLYDMQASRIQEFLAHIRSLGPCEAIIVPNHRIAKTQTEIQHSFMSLTQRDPEVQVINPPIIAGKGSAIRHALPHCRGEAIMFIDDDMPFSVECVSGIIARFRESGADWVSGERQEGERTREVLLRRIFSRLFNWFVCGLFHIESPDTQCGVKIMKRDFAFEAFKRTHCNSFYFDIELFLFSRLNGKSHFGYPVFVQQTGSSTICFLYEAGRLLVKVFRIYRRYRAGFYKVIDWKNYHVTADDWGLAREVNDAILELARLGIVKRVSIMANMPHVTYRLHELRELRVETGLHLNLTEGTTGMNRNRLFFSLLFRRETRSQVLAAFTEQLSILESFGLDVSYVDGHEHTHLFPHVMDTIYPALRERSIEVVRLPLDVRLLFSRQAPVFILAWLNRPFFRESNLKSLRFVYPRSGDWLNLHRISRIIHTSPQHEILTHPSLINLEKDLLARHAEYHALKSLYTAS
jgi:predicted glycoside hydrolase/deacetylase ChbG (UPF0249 family)